MEQWHVFMAHRKPSVHQHRSWIPTFCGACSVIASVGYNNRRAGAVKAEFGKPVWFVARVRQPVLPSVFVTHCSLSWPVFVRPLCGGHTASAVARKQILLLSSSSSYRIFITMVTVCMTWLHFSTPLWRRLIYLPETAAVFIPGICGRNLHPAKKKTIFPLRYARGCNLQMFIIQ